MGLSLVRMLLLPIIVFLLLVTDQACSFVVPSSVKHFSTGSIVIHPHSGHSSSSASLWNNQSVRSGVVVSAASSSSTSKNEVRDDPDGILPASVGVGIVTAGVGFAYGQCLRVSQSTLWKTLPNYLLSKNISIHPLYFITGMFTLGGCTIGILSSLFESVEYTVADFVSAFSSSTSNAESETENELPNSRTSLMPLLLMSLVTSAFGFSLGPEAPMVCAGSILGASIGKKIFDKPSNNKLRNIRTCAYSGAAGALTAFMGIPIAGSIFALEMTRSSAGITSSNSNVLSPAIAASLAALVVLKGILLPHTPMGGHFDYGLSNTLISGRSMVLGAVASGLGGALIGTGFHKLVTFLKHTLWPTTTNNTTKQKEDGFWNAKNKRRILIKTCMGLLIGLLSTKFPQTMFWGEGSLQCVIDGQQTPFEATPHGLAPWLTSMAMVSTSQPYATSQAAILVGSVKVLSIALACAGKFPGGIIFPLFAAAAPFAHGFASNLVGPTLLPMIVLSLMTATQAAVTRTPLASSLILCLTASHNTAMSTMLPASLLASYISVWASQYLSSKSYFQYSEQTTS